ncbi:MAG: haloalkane dehalogenase [Dehalococcoidia bacterium]|nr:haloalkane dehalogenase [Dehalococcoidia bacterium]
MRCHMSILPLDPHPRRRVPVLDSGMSYVDTGVGTPVVFLHGNPTSSFLWRNIIAEVKPAARCLAPDLIGMGRSGRAPSGSYRFVEHARYLDAWFDAIGIREDIILVGHDWGSALAFHWANRHRDRIAGLVYMEAIVQSLTWEQWPDAATRVFQGFRSDSGESMVLDNNVFVERVLPGSIIRDLTEQEMAVYREPFLEPGESRRPTLTWPREIPLGGQPEDVVQIVDDYSAWLSGSDVPKLFINADPGAILTGTQRDYCRTWHNQREVTVKGVHFIQEDSPDEIGQSIVQWLGDIE